MGAAVSGAIHAAVLGAVAVTVSSAPRVAAVKVPAAKRAAEPIQVTFFRTAPLSESISKTPIPRPGTAPSPTPLGARRRTQAVERTATPTTEAQPEQGPAAKQSTASRKLDLSPASVARMFLGAPTPDGTTNGALLPAQRDSARSSPFGEGFQSVGGGAHEAERETFRTRISRDGDIDFRDKGNVQMDTWVNGRFDTTDMVMRAIGDDPYAYQKLKIADATRETRLGMARVDRSHRLKASVRATRALLVRIWSNRRIPAAKRRRILFALWDECAEEGPAEVVKAGNLVRATIIGFIRKHLPAASTNAYTRAELSTLNKTRASHQPFTPYRP